MKWLTKNCNTRIARSNGNQSMKFGQLIQHNMRNISLKNYTQNVVEKVLQDSLLKNQN